MKLKDMPIEELELLSYGDIASLVLNEKHKAMNTPTLFKEICNLLGFTDDEYASKIGDFYTSLNNDKRFILLENGEWDLSNNHSVEFVVEDDEDDETDSIEIEEEEESDKIEDIDAIDDDNELDDEDDLDELSIIEDDEENED
ncbi:MAG: DNA-directed RNA polymerase subunit delta [Bacilli bacterium]|nr:DNA-directed RNA polymerase subunit delta [Bacilli bacterium]